MIILKVKADNLYCFKNFEIDFSYKTINPSSLIEYEYLEKYPNIKFKKLNIFIGTNASGKTVFGKLLSDILFFIENRDDKILNNIAVSEKKSMFSIDFIIKKEEYILYRVECDIENFFIKNLKIQSANIKSRESYQKTTERLETIFYSINNNEEFLTDDMMRALKNINLKSGALFCFTDEIISGNKNITYDINILNTILKVFDNSIKEIKEVEGTDNGYLIIFNHGSKLLIQNGKAVEGDILSSGTKEGLSIAYIISEMKKNPNRLFYIDEKFSHVHTDIEKTTLSVMLELLGKESQLFFTTHNLDILEMSFPHHSFTFFSKREDEVKVIYSESSKNDRFLKNKAENDFFETVPDYSSLFEIIGDKNE